jgi:hypothetical protein
VSPVKYEVGFYIPENAILQNCHLVNLSELIGVPHFYYKWAPTAVNHSRNKSESLKRSLKLCFNFPLFMKRFS